MLPSIRCLRICTRGLLVVGVLILSAATVQQPGASQTTSGQENALPALTQDAQAVALIQQILAVAGPPISASSVSTTEGTIRLGSDSTLHPIRIYTMGSDHVRSEIERSGGTSVMILNAGNAAFISAAGRARHLNMLNTVSERVEHIPTMSLIADADHSHLQFEYLGNAQVNGTAVQQIAVSWSNAENASDQKEFLKRTRVVYSVESATLHIVQMEYTKCAEEDSNALMHYRVAYSNYQLSGSRSIPTTVTTFLNGAFLQELKVTSYEENSPPPTGAFDIPEVTR